MAQVNAIDIRCEHCQTWFPSPIFVGESKTLDLSVMYGNQAECTTCGKRTACNKENMRARDAEGGFLGSDT